MKTFITCGALFCSMVSLSLVASAKNADKAPHTVVVQKNMDDVQPQDIINQYIQAIGGKENIDKLKTYHAVGTATAQGYELSYETKKMNPNKSLVTVSMNGSVVMKRVFDGTAGYSELQGNKTDMTSDDIKKQEEIKGIIIPQEFYNMPGYTLAYKGITKVNDKPAYTIEVTSPSGNKSTEYYDSASHLLVRQDETQGEAPLSIFLDAYKAVNNVLMPYKMSQHMTTPNGEMDVDIVTNTITVNGNDVTDADFK